MAFVRKHWVALLTILPFLPTIWREAIRLLDWGARIDLIATKLHEAGGMKGVLAFLINPPAWLIWPSVAIAIALLLWDKRRNEPQTEVVQRRWRVNSWGPWVLIIGAPLLGLLWLYMGSVSKSHPPVPLVATPAAPPTPSPAPREFANRTPRQLLAFYENLTPFQADKLIQPYKGLWIEAESQILNILAEGQGRSIVILRDAKDTIDCRFGPQWGDAIGRLATGETLRVIGKINDSQNGQQLYLSECEVLPKAPAHARRRRQDR